MTFFRHFIERPDFKTLVATNSQHIDEYNLPYTPLSFELSAWLQRVSRTRFLPWIYGLQCLYGTYLLPAKIVKVAVDFKPDAVFTVAGSWDWTALAAQRLARQLKIPLVASFNDWYDYGWFPAHPHFRPAIESRFRRFYQEADLALCTSEGMREALGIRRNVYVLYPTGAPLPAEDDAYEPVPVSCDRTFSVLFGGNLADWYGTMIESVITFCQTHHPHIQFKIFGSRPSWSSDFEQWAIRTGIYGGQVSFAELRAAAVSSDLLLLPMGFAEACAQVERTSFKTKFLDYLSFRRPILVWGPDYCSAVRTAREFDSAECITEDDPSICAAAIVRLAKNPARRKQLIDHALHMYQDRFHPDTIHAGLVEKIRETIGSYRAASTL